ncbi:MAG: hypothetical protein ACJZ8K_01630 [Paracoccaceae bacterium]
MAEKSKAKKVKIESSQADLKEILGDIKTVVSGEREALFKVSEYKTIKLKKENLVAAGEKKYSIDGMTSNDKELENLIRKIVKSELKNFKIKDKTDSLKTEKKSTVKAVDDSSIINSLKKDELIALSKKNKLDLSGKNTKAEIIKKLKENKIKVP